MGNKSFVFYQSFRPLAELDDATRLQLYDAVTKYGLFGTLSDKLPIIVRAILAPILPTIDAATQRYEKRGGRPRKEETVKNHSETVSKPTETVSKPTENSFSLNVNDNENVNVNDNVNADADEEEDTNGGRAASSSSSSSSESFSPSAFILNFWNSVGQQYPYLKKIEYISPALEQKIVSGYEFALTCCDNDVNRAKNMLAKAVANMAQSKFFAQNQGKATLTWLFASTDNLEKCANGQYNDY